MTHYLILTHNPEIGFINRIQVWAKDDKQAQAWAEQFASITNTVVYGPPRKEIPNDAT